MDFPKIHESEYRFCLIMWEHEPVTAVTCMSAIALLYLFFCGIQVIYTLSLHDALPISLSSVLESVVC